MVQIPSSDSKNGRFWQIDPLASEYPYNSPYAFQENKFGSGIELEGKELFPWANVIVSQEPILVRPVAVERIMPEPISPRIGYGSNGTGELVPNLLKAPIRPYRASQMGSKGGRGAGKEFSRKTLKDTWEEQGGECTSCGKEINRYGQSKRGETPTNDQAQADHIFPKNPSRGSTRGNNTKNNLEWLCRGCNNEKSNTLPNEYFDLFKVTPRDATNMVVPMNPIDIDKNKELNRVNVIIVGNDGKPIWN